MSEDIFNMRDNRISSYVAFTFANSCMPTLIKCKPSSLVTFSKRHIHDEADFYRVLEQELLKFDCMFELLYVSDTLYYVLVYYKPLLEEVINQYSEHAILREKGYVSGNLFLDSNIRNFKIRFYKYQSKEIDFPHELGIFLGYPIKDVEEYIKNDGQNYMLCGYWKVYDNVEEASKMFQRYTELRERAVNLFFSGQELYEINVFA